MLRFCEIYQGVFQAYINFNEAFPHLQTSNNSP